MRVKSNMGEQAMFRKTSLGVFILGGVLVAIPVGQVTAAGNVPGVQGVWTCSIVRAGTIQRPIIYTFNSDGTFNYSSATTINSTTPGPVANSGFHSRGGGRGEWTRVSNNVFSYKAVELLYDANGNAAGSFSVDATIGLTSAGQLCSGRSECPNLTSSISLVKYTFDQNDPDLNITGLQYLLLPGTPSNTLCNTLSSGAGFPALPIPTP
jgi:hypothetical protein